MPSWWPNFGNPLAACAKPSRPTVLLLDEVDVFFSDSFFGSTFNPAETICSPHCFSILSAVWERRTEMVAQPEESSVDSILNLPAMQQLLKDFPGFRHFVHSEIAEMVQRVKDFGHPGEPRLAPVCADYVTRADGKIGYIDQAAGIPDFNTTYSYTTAFTYFHCWQVRKVISKEQVEQHAEICPLAGMLLYSSLPRAYDYCIGMSGTLSCLSDSQNALLEDYRLGTCKTITGSTFNKKQLNQTADGSKVDTSHTATEVVTGDWDEYFEKLLQEANYVLENGRALLIVVADEKQLDKFWAEFQKRKLNHSQYEAPLQLSDRLRDSVRKSVIVKAIRKYAITLMTRSYGRGTDFVCRDKGLTKNGGVHVVVTFFPVDASEDRQIQGRTCRQDDPGSYKKLLFEPDLSYLGATENDKNSKG
eukprot:2363926-Rhodomonas_salina.1